MRVVSIAVCGALLSSCATSPDRIASAYVSPVAYQNMTCEQIDTEIYAVDTKANELYRRIGRRASNDSIYMGVGLIVAWPALLFLSGGKSHEAVEYGQLKGTKDALISARRTCGYGPAASTAARGEIPGTVHMGRVTLVPAETPSGICIVAPANYVGTGATNAPAITRGTPRCSSLAPQ